MNTYDRFYSNQLKKTLTKLESIDKKNKELAKTYFEYLKHEVKASDSRIIDLIERFIIFADILKKPLDKATKEDAQKIVKHADNLTCKERSKSNIKAIYKQIRKYLTGNIDFPEDVRWIKGKVLLDYRKVEEVTPDQIMTIEDFKKFLNCIDTARDKAMFSLMGELGLRPKEALMLKIKHIDLSNPQYILVTVPSDTKTGSRTVPCIFAKKWLIEWIVKGHPHKDNKEMWLFTQQRRNHDQQLSYKGLEFKFNEIKKIAGFDKKFTKFTLYQFRKLSYTFKALKGWSDQQIKAFHGLQPKSKAIDVYVKINPKDLIDNMKEMYGLKVKKEKGKTLTVITCPNCQEENPDSNKQCEKCGLLFDIGEANKKVKENDQLKDELGTMKDRLTRMEELILQMAEKEIKKKKTK